ncbi:MAG: class I SAM-dependent methyltransferase [Melioribacteraceae bacterium]|nr:class I SAM-dependent methyltransferase [Melioribacteraceae bacterium]
MFEKLVRINSKPKPFEFYTAIELWTNEYTAQQMLQYHLMDDIDAASRNKAFMERSAEFIIKYFKMDESMDVADFGCGPGLYAQKFAKTGAKITGIDVSDNSIKYAKAQAEKDGLDVDYITADYLNFETDKKFDLILLIFTDLCVLSFDQRSILLKKFRSLLKPEGRIFMDVSSYAAFDAKEESASYEKNQLFGFWSPNDYYGFLNTFKYDEEKISLDKHTIIEDGVDDRVIYNWHQYYNLESITNELKDHGLQVEEVFGNVAGDKFDDSLPEIALKIK